MSSPAYVTRLLRSWVQLMTHKLLNRDPVECSQIPGYFLFIWFDTVKKVKTEKYLWALEETRPTAHYTHKFNLKLHNFKWEVHMAGTDFFSLKNPLKLAIKVHNKMHRTNNKKGTFQTRANPNPIDESVAWGYSTPGYKATLQHSCLGKLEPGYPCVDSGTKEIIAQIIQLRDKLGEFFSSH